MYSLLSQKTGHRLVALDNFAWRLFGNHIPDVKMLVVENAAKIA